MRKFLRGYDRYASIPLMNIVIQNGSKTEVVERSAVKYDWCAGTSAQEMPEGWAPGSIEVAS